MAKFYGVIGFAETTETAPNVWEEVITEKNYTGDIVKNSRRLESGNSINDSITVSNTISIVADPYANLHFFNIRYAQWMGNLWKITNVEVERPRLLLTIGDLYNG
jgi:hypothetical protein